MTEISDETLDTLRDLAEQQQRLQQQQQLILKTVLAEHGLDPDTHEVDLQEGVIRKIEQ
jgi:hypothetical protein